MEIRSMLPAVALAAWQDQCNFDFDIFLKIPFSLKIVTKYLLELEFVNTQQLLSLPKRLPPHVANRVQLVHSPAITQSRFQLKNINSIAN